MVTSTIGSGWLFAPYLSARLAAGASLLSWLLGGGMAFLIALASLLLLLFGWINLAGVGVLARWIEGLTVWKLVVPLTVSLVLIAKAGHWGNLAIGGGQSGGVLEALGTGGILFSLLGFRTAMDLAGEARRPQRDVPLAIYLVLQLAFLVAVPPAELSQGWAALQLTAHGGPLVAVALGLGFGGLATLLLTDAVISPSGTAMAYMAPAARLNCRIWPAPIACPGRPCSAPSPSYWPAGQSSGVAGAACGWRCLWCCCRPCCFWWFAEVVMWSLAGN